MRVCMLIALQEWDNTVQFSYTFGYAPVVNTAPSDVWEGNVTVQEVTSCVKKMKKQEIMISL